MSVTYWPIQTVELTSNSAVVNFSNIPQTYNDLLLRYNARDTTTTGVLAFLTVSMNGITTNYSRVTMLSWPGTGVFSNQALGTQAAFDTIAYNAIATLANAPIYTFGSGDLYIPNYVGSRSKYAISQGMSEDTTTAGGRFYISGYTQTSTAAVTSLAVKATNTFIAGSTFRLYGINNV